MIDPEVVEGKLATGGLKAYPIVFNLHADHVTCQCAGCRAFHDPLMQAAFTALSHAARVVFQQYGLLPPESLMPREGFLKDGKL